jgi:hypothetical protein
MSKADAAEIVTELILSARAGVGGDPGFTFVFSLALGTRRLVFRLATEGPVSVKEILEELGDQFGFKVPELPGIGPFRPWDDLYRARLTPELAFSPTTPRSFQGAMALETPLELLIPDLKVKGVRVRYQQAGGGREAAWDFGVDVELFGREQTLAFPFAVPQPKPPLIDLRYFGLGQRVSPRLEGATTMAAVMKKMCRDLRQEEGDALIERLAEFYRPDAGWLAGIWLTIREVVDLQVIFNDPVLYGVALRAGSKLGFLKELEFEVLYQRISDEVGLFYIDLTLPISVREVFLGAWSITLPSIAVWIYTNGDFKLSLGWPLGERSFTIQYLFLIGGGGFYVAKLSSATAPEVPPPPEGYTYDPVLAFGIALRLGVGREFHKGILSATLTLTLHGVFEGRVAWLRARSRAEMGLAAAGEPGAHLPAAVSPGQGALAASEGALPAVLGAAPSVFDYFWFRGTFGIVGVIEGVVDFSIVKASVTVRLEASVTVTFQTGQATTIRVSAGVTVRLRVEVGSFKIFGKRISIGVDLSFHADVTEEFVVDNRGAALVLEAQFALLEALPWDAVRLPWAHLRPVLPLLFSPRVTRVGPRAQFVATLTIPTQKPPGQDWSPFEALARAVAEWQAALHARQEGGDGPGRAQAVTRERLRAWGTRLARTRYLNVRSPGNPDSLSYEAIVAFLEKNFVLEVEAPPPPTGDEPPESVAGAVFPMLPPLVLEVTGQSSGRPRTVRFDDTSRRDARYVRNLRAYYDALRISFASPEDRLLALAEDAGTPMARLVFEDYFAALVKEMRAELDRVVAERGTAMLPDALDAVDYAGVAARVSRFLQAGLRPPNEPIPEDSAGWPSLTLAPLYVQTGQQFPLELGDAAYTLTLTIPEAVQGWVRPGPDGTRIEIPAGDAAAREALAAFEALPLDAEVLERRWLPPLASRPLRLTLKELTDWDRRVNGATARHVLATVSGQLARVVPAEGRVVRVFRTAIGEGGGEPEPLAWAPAVRVDLSLSRVQRARREGEVAPDGRPDGVEPHLYQLGGADERNRRVLEGLLNAPGGLDGAFVHLLYPAAGDAPGLRSAVAGDGVLLIKTNLSTESNPAGVRQNAAFGEEPADPVHASLAELRAFLTIVWQAAVVNSGGFYLRYADSAGNDLPDDLFTRGPSTSFTLLVSFAAAVDARLFPYHDAMVLEPAAAAVLEAGAGRTLYVAPADVLEWDSAQPAGTLGFEVRRRNPNRTLTPPPSLRAVAGADGAGVTRAALLEAARAAGVRPGSDEEARLLDEAGEAAAQLQNLFNLLQFRVAAGERFRQSVWSIPVGPGQPDPDPEAGARFRALRAAGPMDEPADWLYQQVPAVFRFAGESQRTDDPTRYAGVGGSVGLEFRVLDLFGNVMDASDPVRLPPAEVLFHDRLVPPDAWPGCSLDYAVARKDGAPRLTVTLRFQPGAVVPGAGRGDVPDRPQADAAAAARVAWGRVYDQVRDPSTAASAWFSAVEGELAVDVAALAGFTRGIRDWLGAVHPGESWPTLPPVEHVLMWTLPDLDARSPAPMAFRVRAALRLRRTANVAADAERLNPDSARVESVVAPHIPSDPAAAGEAQGTLRLQRFARDFENAFGGRLRLALGAETADAGLGSGDSLAGPGAPGGPLPGELWAVRVGAPGGIEVKPGAGRSYFAPVPLSRHLVNGTFRVRHYVDGPWTGGASDFTEGERVFAQVDLDAQAAAFLAAFDGFLAPALAVPVARLAPAAFAELMSLKQAIARSVSRSVAPVFDPDDAREATDTGDTGAAVEAMYQRLLIRLAAAYEVDTIVQLPVTVSVPPPLPGSAVEPRYYGPVEVAPEGPTADARTDAQFSVGRLSLRPDDAQAAAAFVKPLTFLFAAARPTEQRSFRVHLRWTVGFLERRTRSPEPGEAGERVYTPSSWLRFVESDAADALTVALGEFEVPVPLRRFPASPVLVHQDARATHRPPASIAEALRWTYCLEYRQAQVAQDRIRLEVDYNVAPPPALPPAPLAAAGEERPLPRSLFEALARYAAEGPAVWARVGAIAAAADGDETRRPEALAVITRFTELVRGAAKTWTGDGLTVADAALHQITDRYWLEDEDGGEVIRVHRDAVEPAPPVWPDIRGYAPEDAPAPAPDERRYRRIATVAGVQDRFEAPEVTRALAFPAHRLGERQNARAGASVQRNADLGERRTNPAFVYETAPVAFANPVAPLVSASGLSLDDLPGDALAGKLASFFTAVFEPAPESVLALRTGADERLIRLEVAYRYTLAEPDGRTPLRVEVPLLLVDDYRFAVPTDGDPAQPGTFARMLLEALSTWHRTQQPAAAGAALVFTLVMFSNFSESKLPVLTLDGAALSAPPDAAWWTVPGA